MSVTKHSLVWFWLDFRVFFFIERYEKYPLNVLVVLVISPAMPNWRIYTTLNEGVLHQR